MRNFTKAIAGAALLLLTYTGTADAWTKGWDFESESSEVVYNGKASRKFTFTESKTGGAWWESGGFPTKIQEGGELWGRGYWYMKSPWSWGSYHKNNPDWTGCSNHTPATMGKFMRFHRKRTDGSNGAYVSIYKQGSGIPRMDVEGSSTGVNKHQNIGDDTPLPLDEWVCVEMYCLFKSTETGIIRMWINGELELEYKGQVTMNRSSDVVDFALVWSYWNCGAPQNQVAYTDDLIITSDTPDKQDAFGNKMIGPDGLAGIVLEKGIVKTSMGSSLSTSTCLYDITGRRMNSSGIKRIPLYSQAGTKGLFTTNR